MFPTASPVSPVHATLPVNPANEQEEQRQRRCYQVRSNAEANKLYSSELVKVNPGKFDKMRPTLGITPEIPTYAVARATSDRRILTRNCATIKAVSLVQHVCWLYQRSPQIGNWLKEGLGARYPVASVTRVWGDRQQAGLSGRAREGANSIWEGARPDEPSRKAETADAEASQTNRATGADPRRYLMIN